MVSEIDYSLYVILDAARLRGREPGRLTDEVCEGGATVIQYRAKGKGERFHEENIPPILEAARRHGIPLIINNHVELAIRFGADGVHLGQADLPVAKAREMGGIDLIIGATVHCIGEATRAIEHGADYLSVGSVFHTDTKDDIRIVGPGVLEEICRHSTIPTIAIGGITEDRLGEVFARGPHGVAVIRAILDSRHPRETARRFRKLIDTYRSPSR